MKTKFIFYLFITVLWLNLYSFKFILIEPNESEINSFHVMTTAVTQALFEEVMSYNNSYHQGEMHPITNVSWYEAIIFCNKLSEKHILQPVYKLNGNNDVNSWGALPAHRLLTWTNIEADPEADGYRLLTNKEWDYLYRQIINNQDFSLEEVAFVFSNSENTTHPVAQKRSDILGLYDFLGNVKEWYYEDRGIISPQHYESLSPEKIAFYESLSYRKFRRNDYITVKNRYGLYPVTKNSQIGFRIAKS